MATSERPAWGIRGLADQANPAFAAVVVVVPVLALGGALGSGNVQALTYVHVMAGVLWTGTDLFMGFVLGPVLGSLDTDERASVYERMVPKMTFMMPVLAMVTITGGIELARRVRVNWLADPWIQVALGIVTLLSIVGFGIILPNELRAYREMTSEDPDRERIGEIGLLNAKLGAVQGLLQLSIIFVMVGIRYGSYGLGLL